MFLGCKLGDLVLSLVLKPDREASPAQAQSQWWRPCRCCKDKVLPCISFRMVCWEDMCCFGLLVAVGCTAVGRACGDLFLGRQLLCGSAQITTCTLQGTLQQALLQHCFGAGRSTRGISSLILLCTFTGSLALGTAPAQVAGQKPNTTQSAYILDLALRFTGPTLVPFTTDKQVIMIYKPSRR